MTFIQYELMQKHTALRNIKINNNSTLQHVNCKITTEISQELTTAQFSLFQDNTDKGE